MIDGNDGQCHVDNFSRAPVDGESASGNIPHPFDSAIEPACFVEQRSRLLSRRESGGLASQLF